MTCSTGSCAAAAHFDPTVAERDLRRYQRYGPDLGTRILLSELRRWPLRGLHLLDVGAGIGVIAVELAGEEFQTQRPADDCIDQHGRQRVDQQIEDVIACGREPPEAIVNR